MAARKKATKKTARKPARSTAKRTTKKAAKKPAAKKAGKKTARRTTKKTALELIISKSRTKGAVKACNVSGDFYGALDAYVREAITAAEDRAQANGRKTLRPQDL